MEWTADTVFMELAAGKVAVGQKSVEGLRNTDKYENNGSKGQSGFPIDEQQSHSEHSLHSHLSEFPNWYTDNLGRAFDRTPNCASPGGAGLFITTILLERGKREIHGMADLLGIKQFWEQVFVPLFLAHYSSLTLHL